MTHQQAFSHESQKDKRDCTGNLIDPNTSYSSDVYWEVFTCEKCLATVFTVEGSIHWWNHEGTPSESRKRRQDEMRQLALTSDSLTSAIRQSLWC